MLELAECLIQCNLKLESLRTKKLRFVAWIVYSTKHNAFVAGVDTYSNDETNLMHVATNAIDATATEAINQVYVKVCDWEKAGSVPL